MAPPTLTSVSLMAQGVDRDYSSLIFDRKEAEQLSRDQAYKLGVAGLCQLKTFYPFLNEIELDLFDEANINLNRSALIRDENSKLSDSLERFIAAIAPYFNHQSCKQVLEWLIYRYSIHTCNAEFLATALLPFHDTNAYGWLGSILLLKNNEWQWLKQITADGSPIAFNDIVQHTLKGGGNWRAVMAMFALLDKVQEFFDEDYVNKHFEYYFLFLTEVVVNICRDPIIATDSMVMTILPKIGWALMSRIPSFKLAGCDVIRQLSSMAYFTAVLQDPIVILLLSELQKVHFDVVMHTLISLCQQQDVECLPLRAVRILVRRSEELEFADFLSKAGAQGIDLAAFLEALWNALFKILLDNVSDAERAAINAILEATTSPAILTSLSTHVFFEQVMKNDAVSILCDLSPPTWSNIRRTSEYLFEKWTKVVRDMQNRSTLSLERAQEDEHRATSQESGLQSSIVPVEPQTLPHPTAGLSETPECGMSTPPAKKSRQKSPVRESSIEINDGVDGNGSQPDEAMEAEEGTQSNQVTDQDEASPSQDTSLPARIPASSDETSEAANDPISTESDRNNPPNDDDNLDSSHSAGSEKGAKDQTASDAQFVVPLPTTRAVRTPRRRPLKPLAPKRSFFDFGEPFDSNTGNEPQNEPMFFSYNNDGNENGGVDNSEYFNFNFPGAEDNGSESESNFGMDFDLF